LSRVALMREEDFKKTAAGKKIPDVAGKAGIRLSPGFRNVGAGDAGRLGKKGDRNFHCDYTDIQRGRTLLSTEPAICDVTGGLKKSAKDQSP